MGRRHVSKREPVLDERFTAAIDLVRRTGAKEVQVRYSDDEQPVVWFVVAGYISRGGKPVSTGKVNAWKVGSALTPHDAIFRLLDDTIDGAECAHCHRPSGFVEGFDANMPLDRHVCWYQYDPELKRYRRGCEGDT